ncbi:hypothetical protein RND81_11G203300 [Saponaria officinalis]|uniref:Gamma-secretase subunit PEN-2 n=1 Tax=Saponaria officinalis TaxID=3572 RepID=A0AAW1HNN1_SAPOF
MARSDEQATSSGEQILIPISTTAVENTSPMAANQSIRWPTIDGPLGLSVEDSLTHARRFYKFGFMLLPWLWAVNCFYFWPVLRHPHSFPSLHHYVSRSAIGFTIVTVMMCTWALTFSIGGERLFGPMWNTLVMYNVADEFGLTGWM